MAIATQVTVQDKLLKFDNLLSGLELLTEEVRTRKDLVLSDEHLEELITNVLNKDDRMAEIVRRIVSRIGNTTIIRGVTREIRAEFETHIDTYIAQQLTEQYMEARLDRLIAIHSAGGTVAVASPEPEARSLEELTYESVDDISERFKILAGDDAWV
jgi:hypothetical protein